MDIKTCKHRVRVWAFILKTQSILLRLGRFINYLPYKSDEMSYVAFPDERYDKHKFTTTCRDEVWEASVHTCKQYVSVGLLWTKPLCDART